MHVSTEGATRLAARNLSGSEDRGSGARTYTDGVTRVSMTVDVLSDDPNPWGDV
jgi:hypothetical protein